MKKIKINKQILPPVWTMPCLHPTPQGNLTRREEDIPTADRKQARQNGEPSVGRSNSDVNDYQPQHKQQHRQDKHNHGLPQQRHGIVFSHTTFGCALTATEQSHRVLVKVGPVVVGHHDTYTSRRLLSSSRSKNFSIAREPQQVLDAALVS